MEASIGVNLRVTAHSNQGGRKYMEDMFCVAYQPTADEKDLLYAYFGMFDGHGGREAAMYAKLHLMDHIVSQKNFWSDDDELVKRAIHDGFLSTHYAMWRDLENWPKTQSGLPSTSGTTASIAFVRRGKLYIGHVGDSGIVLGIQDQATGFWRAKQLTNDHKPESETENARILQCGGKVISKSGVPRVVWNRPRIGHKGPVRRSTLIDEIPFLAVARSLGDLWSYNSAQNEFVVSPVPDVTVIDIDVTSHRCLILGSDGLWNMLSPQDAVNGVYVAEKSNERQLLAAAPDVSSSQVKNWINPSKRLVDRALGKWYHHNLRADNTSVVTVVIDPPGPPKAQQIIRHNQRNNVQRPQVPASAQRNAVVVGNNPSVLRNVAVKNSLNTKPGNVGTLPQCAPAPICHYGENKTTASSCEHSTLKSSNGNSFAKKDCAKLDIRPRLNISRKRKSPTSPSSGFISNIQPKRAKSSVVHSAQSHASPQHVCHKERTEDVQINEVSSSSESAKPALPTTGSVPCPKGSLKTIPTSKRQKTLNSKAASNVVASQTLLASRTTASQRVSVSRTILKRSHKSVGLPTSNKVVPSKPTKRAFIEDSIEATHPTGKRVKAELKHSIKTAKVRPMISKKSVIPETNKPKKSLSRNLRSAGRSASGAGKTARITRSMKK